MEINNESKPLEIPEYSPQLKAREDPVTFQTYNDDDNDLLYDCLQKKTLLVRSLTEPLRKTYPFHYKVDRQPSTGRFQIMSNRSLS